MKLWHAPIGKLVKGHVLDVSLKPFERALKDYDKQLYVSWNHKKLKGWGCWEIRRLPNTKTAVHKGTHKGVNFLSLEHVETDFQNHILDCAFLNYDQLRRIKEMDTWAVNNWADQMEKRETEAQAQIRDKARQELRYSLRHNKRLTESLYDVVRSGTDPAQIVTSIKWAQKT